MCTFYLSTHRTKSDDTLQICACTFLHVLGVLLCSSLVKYFSLFIIWWISSSASISFQVFITGKEKPTCFGSIPFSENKSTDLLHLFFFFTLDRLTVLVETFQHLKPKNVNWCKVIFFKWAANFTRHYFCTCHESWVLCQSMQKKDIASEVKVW